MKNYFSNKSTMSCFSSSSSAVSREIQNLRNEIKILATEAKRKHSNLSFQNSKLEEDMIDERRQKRQTEEKLKQIARTAEKIKNASQQKIRMVTCRAENAENELNLAKEQIFNMESELILLRDDSTNLR